MLCEICEGREAQLHLSQDVGTHTNQVAVCEECLRRSVPPELAAMLLANGSLSTPDTPKKREDE